MQTVIVLGTHNSGSGLVHEYLSSRNDFSTPFGHNEFRICSDPGGLNYLFNATYNNPGFFNNSYAVSNFLSYIKKLEKSKEYKKENVKVNLYKKNLYLEARKFINKITKVQYFAIPHYRRINLTTLEKIKIKINKRILKKKLPDTKINSIVLFHDEKKFLFEANKFINKILVSNIGKNYKKNIVLNNGGDILNPIETTKYYTNPKIITVSRDPRDIFASMKARESLATPWYDVDIFINWYKTCFDHSIYSKNKKILNLKFEKLLLNFNRENKKICKFLAIKEKIKMRKTNYFNFDINSSKKNIGKYKKVLKYNEIQKIEKKLRRHLNY